MNLNYLNLKCLFMKGTYLFELFGCESLSNICMYALFEL